MRRLCILLSGLLASGCLGPAPGDPRPEMVRLPAGSFVQGSDPGETAAAGYPDAYAAREQPARVTTIARAFAIGRTEVTRREFERFVAATGWKPGGPCGFLADGPSNRWDSDLAHNWRTPGFPQRADHPVVCVSFADAQGYAAWLSTATGRRFRLPSGAEWEYAARAGTAGAQWWHGRSASPCSYANLSDQRRARAHNGGKVDPKRFFDCDDGYVATAPAASFEANPWGLHDMLGNVWEWTSDCLEPACASRIDRGASWTNSPMYVRAAARHPDLAEARTTVLGFRLVEELP